MFLDIHELERHPLDFEEEFQPDVIDLGGEARQRTPLKASGRAETGRGASRQASDNQGHTAARTIVGGTRIAVRPLPRAGGARC